MPKLRVNGVEIHYRERGSGSPILFGHSLTLDGSMYDEATTRLSKQFRTIQVDFRGHGESEKVDADYSLEDITVDLSTLITRLGLKSVHYVGLSMGGMVGMRLALAHPGLIRALVLLDTSAEAEEKREEFEQWAEMTKDMEPNEQQVQAVLHLMVSPEFGSKPSPILETLKSRLLSNHVRGVYRASLAVIRRTDILSQLGRIRKPALVMVGDRDIATPPRHAEAIHRAIPGSEMVQVPGSGHLSILEQPAIVLPKIEAFLDKNRKELNHGIM
ncbi:MAG: alpha/beta fold hydrolase [Nitrospirae bacterium]|nr:alpha/beta fold hydrolase [Nitrospirota bacterium]